MDAAAAAMKNMACLFRRWIYSGEASANAKLSFLRVDVVSGLLSMFAKQLESIW